MIVILLFISFLIPLTFVLIEYQSKIQKQKDDERWEEIMQHNRDIHQEVKRDTEINVK